MSPFYRPWWVLDRIIQAALGDAIRWSLTPPVALPVGDFSEEDLAPARRRAGVRRLREDRARRRKSHWDYYRAQAWTAVRDAGTGPEADAAIREAAELLTLIERWSSDDAAQQHGTPSLADLKTRVPAIADRFRELAARAACPSLSADGQVGNGVMRKNDNATTIDLEKQLDAVMDMLDPEQLKIHGIAADTTRSASDRMIDICLIDSRYAGWDSERLGRLLGCSGPAVRKGDWWNKDRKKYID
jgi:hypothetical protein